MATVALWQRAIYHGAMETSATEALANIANLSSVTIKEKKMFLLFAAVSRYTDWPGD